MDKSNLHYEDWHIVFTNSKLKHWLMPHLTPGFQHCFAVKESDGGHFWIIADSKICYTDIHLASKLDYPHIRLLCPDSVILSIRAIIRPENQRYTFCVFNCVELCKSLLGIKAFWCWTPHQLYRRLTNEQRV